MYGDLRKRISFFVVFARANYEGSSKPCGRDRFSQTAQARPLTSITYRLVSQKIETSQQKKRASKEELEAKMLTVTGGNTS